MKPTNFSKSLSSFLSDYLPHEKGFSKNTIKAYRDAFVLFLIFMKEKNIEADKLTLEHIDKDSIVEFLEWIQTKRNCSDATRNLRLSAIHSFYRYLQYKHPEHLYKYQNILSIPIKKAQNSIINYLTIDGIKFLLEQPDTTKRKGRRDLALLSLMYDTGIRVQELIDLTPSKIRLENPYTICVTGKGKKTRIIPMLAQQVGLLENYMNENQLCEPKANMYPLFHNNYREKLSRAGINYILKKYVKMAKSKNENSIPENISCHSLRHSKAMHLLQAGVNIVYIRDILGHVSVQTTEIYARVDTKHKREAIAKAYKEVKPKDKPIWLTNENLLQWLKSF